MKLFQAAALLLLLSVSSHGASVDGLASVKCGQDVKAVADKVEAEAKRRGFTVFNRLDFAAGAAKTGQSLRPTELLIFGSLQKGVPLMACAQTTAIDLPLKALVWQDEAGQTWLSYNDPAWLARIRARPAQQLRPYARDHGGFIGQRLVRQRRQKRRREARLRLLRQRLGQFERGLIGIGVGDDDKNIFPAHGGFLGARDWGLGIGD